METYLPYIVSVICATISGFTSYAVARKKAKADIQKLEKQHELDLEMLSKMDAMEKEKMEIEHTHQLELKQKEMENMLGSEVFTTLMKEYLRTPAGQSQLRNATNKKHK